MRRWRSDVLLVPGQLGNFFDDMTTKIVTMEDLKNKRIGLLLGGTSAEREVSLETGRANAEALRRRGYNVTEIDVDQTVCQRLIQAGIEVAYIALHGTGGEDGCIQGLLETMGIPYTGSGVQASAVAMDKVTTKRLYEMAGIPVAQWRYPATTEGALELGLPVVVKPRREGSSVGLTVVEQPGQIAAALELARDPMLERYVPGKELSVGVLGSGADAVCLGSVEIQAADGLYDYSAKYGRDDTRYLAPAPVPEDVARFIEQRSLQAHRLLECSGGTRTDFRWDTENDPVMLETNTIPGMTSHSLLPMVAELKGLSYDDLVERLLEGASLKAC